jgi:hypothetical protein
MFPFTEFPRNQKGIALILVLALVVLLAGLVVTFFSRTLTEVNVSNSSAGAVRTNLLASGAITMIIADLKQEILAGSISTTVATSATGNQVVTVPVSPASAVPALALAGTSGIFSFAPNLVKRSAYNQTFFPVSGTNYNVPSNTVVGGAPTTVSYPPSDRAANISTTVTSQNGRYLTPSRWNRPLFLPKQNDGSATDMTPVATGTNVFVPPDWVLVARDGSNPKSWSADLVTSASNNSSITGRYAYVIYDEGGVLDVNAAGYPGVTTLEQSAYKSTLAYADLTQLRNSSGSQLLTPAQIDQIVGWRNYASAQPSGAFPNYTFSTGSNYYNFVLSCTNGSITTGNHVLFNNKSDRQFTSRQELINFLTKGLASDDTQRATFQTALQYLGTFSRDLNQPSLSPDPARLKIVPTDGGNDAVGLESQINPSFLTVRVESSFQRNNRSTAQPGEPLVQTRFALQRLAWLTYQGPSSGRRLFDPGAADPGAADPDDDMWQLTNTYGITKEWLVQGTPSNIYKYFGLYWDSSKNRWVYNHVAPNTPELTSATLPPTAASGAIMTLGEVAAENREPDFIELLKASINIGAIGKGANNNTAGVSHTPPLHTSNSWVAQYKLDVVTDYQIIQIAANIIDQYDCDGYPTVIRFYMKNAASGIRYFTGVENLPYLYRVRAGVVKATLPQLASPVTFRYPGTNAGQSTNWFEAFVPSPPPLPGGGAAGVDKSVTPNQKYGWTGFPVRQGSGLTSSGRALNDAGLAVTFGEPEIWNPHDLNSSPGYPHPSNLRLVADSTDPDSANNNIIDHAGDNPNFRSITNYSQTPSAPGSTYPFAPSVAIVSWNTAWAGSASSYSAFFYNNYGVSNAANPLILYGVNPPSGKATNTDLNFTDLNGSRLLFGEPTLLIHPGVPNGSNLSINAATNALNIVFRDSSTPSSHQNTYKTAGTVGVTCAQDNNTYIGIFCGVAPLQWVAELKPTLDTSGASGYNWAWTGTAGGTPPSYSNGGNPNPVSQFYIISGDTPSLHGVLPTTITQSSGVVLSGNADNNDYPFTYSMQYRNAAGQWTTYDQKSTYARENQRIFWDLPTQSNYNLYGLIGDSSIGTCIDPRTNRFGMPGGWLGTSNRGIPSATGVSTYGFMPSPNSNADIPRTPNPGGYLNTLYLDGDTSTVLATNRADAGLGAGLGADTGGQGGYEYIHGLPGVPGWYPAPTDNWFAQIPADSLLFRLGLFSENNPNAAQYYSDPDGVVRRAMGAYASGTTGLPMATASTYDASGSSSTPQSQSRPIILNRPFRSVADLGYVYSGTPWRNLDMFTPESGFSGLLDVFCINDCQDANGLVEGKVNMNTRQAPVLRAILAGACQDEEKYLNSSPTWALPELLGTNIATALISRTTSTSAGKGPLTNLSELVGKWVGPVNATLGGIDGSRSYDGFSADLSTVLGSGSLKDGQANNIERFREASIRALANAGTVRVWNLMIDVVAQTGRYPTSAKGLNDFAVEGEQRYWVHVAIDRFTGQVLDRQVERVKE